MQIKALMAEEKRKQELHDAFEPGNLPYLENIILGPRRPHLRPFEDGKLKQSKSVGKASAIKSPAVWFKNFVTYVRVV